MRVLLVEDEALTAFGLTAEFELQGHFVLGPVKDLERSLAIAQAERPDVALVDINLKGTSAGLGIASALTHSLHVPVVFLTGYKSQALENRRLATGLITKPVHFGRVVECAEALTYLLNGVPCEIPSDLELFDSLNARKSVRYVLLVSTDDDVRGRMHVLLERLGLTVVSVTDWAAARDQMQAVTYQLVVIDRGLHGDGVELISTIRKIDGQDRTFIVLLGTAGSRMDGARDLTRGADGYLSERCSDKEVLEHVRNVLRIISLRTK